MRDTERERERSRDTGRGRSRLHAGSPMWVRSRVSGVTLWAEGRCSTAEPPGCPSVAVSQWRATFAAQAIFRQLRATPLAAFRNLGQGHGRKSCLAPGIWKVFPTSCLIGWIFPGPGCEERWRQIEMSFRVFLAAYFICLCDTGVFVYLLLSVGLSCWLCLV